jgi:hypothetical protein
VRPGHRRCIVVVAAFAATAAAEPLVTQLGRFRRKLRWPP